MINTPAVYALYEPDLSACRYVGYASNPPRRLDDHLNDASSEENAKSKWIVELRAEGNVPRMIILEELSPEDDWEEREKDWIAHMRGVGEPLLNETSGGKGVADPPPEIREKMSSGGQTNKGKVLSQETKDKIRDSMRVRREEKTA